MFGFDFSTMGPDTCAAVAQTLPVFLVALIAERIVFRARRSGLARQWLATLARVFIDATIVLTLLVLTAYALVGLEKNGLQGGEAKALWFMSGVVALVVVYRWLLLSTPLLDFSRHVARVVADGTIDFLDGLARGAGSVWGLVVLPTARLLDGALTLVGSVLTVGVTDVAFNITTRLLDRISERNRGSGRGDESMEDDRTPG